MIWILLCSLPIGLAAIIVFIYYLKQGQFDELEDVKYQMFREKE